MKILHVVGDSKYGGGAKIVTELTSATIASGHVVLVQTDDVEFKNAVELVGGLAVSANCIVREIRLWRDLRAVARLAEIIREIEPDIVHTHTTKAGFIGRLAARRAGIRHIIHTVHGFAIHERSPVWLTGIYAAFERYAAKRCDCVVTVSNFHRDWARKLCMVDEDLTILTAIRNGIAAPVTSRSFTAREFRRSIGINDQDFLIVSHGRMAAGKGIESTLQAIASVPSIGGRNLHAVFVGDGPRRIAYMEMAQRLELASRVLFTGFRRDVPDFLAASDLVVLPSQREGMSIALLEAMAMGCRIVAGDIGSNREATRGGEAAMLVAPGDTGALGRAITQMLEDQTTGARMACRAREVYLADFTLARMVGEYMHLYRQLMGDERDVGGNE
jgi:glycosyltransferase involved in cell wall biosynthesis